ncbi:protein FAM161B-like [Pyxicephalus adspersus]|uniref:protein FAM161B-like n=1 Tax=Pyxicephalus adspersus TaxID=30357 RepID=UPI003B58ED96
MAGDDPGGGGGLDGDDSDRQFLDTLYSLKSRNSLQLQKLIGLYEVQSSQGVDDGSLHRFFSAPPPRNQDLQSLVVNTTEKPKRSSNTMTVPKPFQMSVAEGDKIHKGQAWADPVHEMKEEDIECYKQFRAQPVPAQVLLPLYHDIMEQQDERRKSDIQRRKEQLMTMQKPFRFLSEERKKSYERPMTTPAQKTQSVVKPIPKSVLDPSVSDRLKGNVSSELYIHQCYLPWEERWYSLCKWRF